MTPEWTTGKIKLGLTEIEYGLLREGPEPASAIIVFAKSRLALLADYGERVGYLARPDDAAGLRWRSFSSDLHFAFEADTPDLAIATLICALSERARASVGAAA